ncbi:nucleotidyltransferase family protein [Altericroceibacterium xinjiangense]|uniref:nucleotidyltransferase family protein n=1 Tax=Altericroceibacterium xinjiangense TaxID=762261 RepID=UPI0030B9E41F
MAETEGVAHKALAVVDGQTLLARVHAALVRSGAERIAVSADNPDVTAEARRLGADVLPPASGPSESVGLALADLGTPLVVTTADHALLEGEWVRDFLSDAPAGCDVALLLARRRDVEAAAPDSKRTWLRFADGDWSGCNLFLLANGRAERAIATWRQVEADRKRPWRIARRLGLGTLWSYWRGKLTLAEAVSRLGQRIGVTAAIVPARNGLAAVDVDKPADLALARQIVAETKNPRD